MDRPKLAPVILSGGVGARLWPLLSRALYPKQPIALNDRLDDGYAWSRLDDDDAGSRGKVPL